MFPRQRKKWKEIRVSKCRLPEIKEWPWFDKGELGYPKARSKYEEAVRQQVFRPRRAHVGDQFFWRFIGCRVCGVPHGSSGFRARAHVLRQRGAVGRVPVSVFEGVAFAERDYIFPDTHRERRSSKAVLSYSRGASIFHVQKARWDLRLANVCAR